MKSFSNMNNSKPQPVDKGNDIQLNIRDIVESALNISIEGELDDYFDRNINIEGKEKLAEKLLNYFNELVFENTSIILEKVKYQGLDNVIIEHQVPIDLKKHQGHIKSLLSKDNPIESATQQANSITSGSNAYHRGMIAEQMIQENPSDKKNLKEISDIFLFKSKQLGYRHYG